VTLVEVVVEVVFRRSRSNMEVVVVQAEQEIEIQYIRN
jgi:hypothetical protein